MMCYSDQWNSYYGEWVRHYYTCGGTSIDFSNLFALAVIVGGVLLIARLFGAFDKEPETPSIRPMTPDELRQATERIVAETRYIQAVTEHELQRVETETARMFIESRKEAMK